LRHRGIQSGQMPPGDRELGAAVRARNARCNCTGAVDHAHSSLGPKAFLESLPLRTRATGVVLGFVRYAALNLLAWRSIAPFSVVTG